MLGRKVRWEIPRSDFFKEILTYLLTDEARYVTIRLQLVTNLSEVWERSDPMAEKPKGLVYRNHPLRRFGKTIYYGSMADTHIIQMHVKESQKRDDLDIATKVAVELHERTGERRDRIVKRSEKDSLYAAMDVSAVWLERALAGK